jgi:RNA polymerase sigma-70 factor (ECF subfamily)
MKYVKDFETSQEIVQEAFVSLWEKRDNIDMAQPVKAYLITTIRNKCFNWLRDNKKFNTDILQFEDYIPDREYVTQDKLVEAEILKAINNAMLELPEKCREIFNLSRFGNLKYQEIADKLQISVKTVETQMSKALQHMRVRLKEFIAIGLLLISVLINYIFF